MNNIVNLYAYMVTSNEIAKKIDELTISEFIKNDEIVSAYFAIFKELVEYVVKLDDLFLLHSELNTIIKEIYEAERLMINSYKMINANMLYDFYKTDYKRLFRVVDELVK